MKKSEKKNLNCKAAATHTGVAVYAKPQSKGVQTLPAADVPYFAERGGLRGRYRSYRQGLTKESASSRNLGTGRPQFTIT